MLGKKKDPEKQKILETVKGYSGIMPFRSYPPYSSSYKLEIPDVEHFVSLYKFMPVNLVDGCTGQVFHKSRHVWIDMNRSQPTIDITLLHESYHILYRNIALGSNEGFVELMARWTMKNESFILDHMHHNTDYAFIRDDKKRSSSRGLARALERLVLGSFGEVL